MTVDTLPQQTRKNAPLAAPIDPGGNILEALGDRFGTVAKLAHRRNSPRVAQTVRSWFPIYTDTPGGDEKARQRLALIQTGLRELSDQMDALHEAAYSPASDPEIRLIVAAMLDGIPAAKSQATAGYIDALAFTLANADEDAPDDSPGARLGFRGFSSAALFVAARRVLATYRFAPSPSELLELARAARFEFWNARNTTRQLFEFRINAEMALDNIHDGDIPFDDTDGDAA